MGHFYLKQNNIIDIAPAVFILNINFYVFYIIIKNFLQKYLKDGDEMSNLDYFTNNKFRALLIMYDNMGKNNVSRVTQQEVADEMGMSRVTLNTVFKQLREDGYIVPDPERMTRYTLTDKAIEAVEMFNRPKLD